MPTSVTADSQPGVHGGEVGSRRVAVPAAVTRVCAMRNRAIPFNTEEALEFIENSDDSIETAILQYYRSHKKD